MKIKENKGITLVALIITVIILLILAGISISALGENGLFTKAQQAKEKQTEAEVKEKINMLVSEYAIEREQGKSLSQFLTEKKDSGEIDDFIDNNNGIFDIIIKGYTTTINESNLSTTEPQIVNDVMVICLAKEFSENKVQALITVKSQSSGIKQIKLINNVTVQGNNNTMVTFDHKIEANTEYQVEVELTNGAIITKTIKYEDTEAPISTIEITKKIIFNSGKIQANIKIEDDRSGVNIKACKWVVVKNSNNLGTEDESLYTGTFTSESSTIQTEDITEPGEYYIHLLLKDNVGNVTEVISEKVEIKEGYEVSTPEELQAMGTNLAGHYYITKDIDMTGFEFTPISGYFTGTLDGQGHTISNLTIINENSSDYNTAIFKHSQYATFENILFKNVNIQSTSYYVGVLVGNAGTLKTVKKVGVTGKVQGKGYVGGIMGQWLQDESKFENCYSRAEITSTGGYDAGGLMGYTSTDNINYDRCYYSGTINATGRIGPFRANYENNN